MAFHHHYAARPVFKLHAASSRIHAGLEVQNLGRGPMEFIYLTHGSFRPANLARLIDTVPDDSHSMRVWVDALPGLLATELHRRLLDALQANPALHRAIGAAGITEGVIDPEIAFVMDCRSDASGWVIDGAMGRQSARAMSRRD